MKLSLRVATIVLVSGITVAAVWLQLICGVYPSTDPDIDEVRLHLPCLPWVQIAWPQVVIGVVALTRRSTIWRARLTILTWAIAIGLFIVVAALVPDPYRAAIVVAIMVLLIPGFVISIGVTWRLRTAAGPGQATARRLGR